MSEEEIRREGVRRDDRASDRQRWVLPLTAVFVSMFVAVGTNLVYTTIAIHKEEQNWCELITGIDDRYVQAPPTDAANIAFAANIHQLRKKLNCK